MLDDLLRRYGRLAAGEGALAHEDEFLALHEHVVGAFALDVGPVAAVIGKDEFVLAALDGAVVARGLVVVHVDAAVLIPPEVYGVAVAAAHVVLAAIAQLEHDARRMRVDAPLGEEGGVVVGAPEELTQRDLARPALDLDRAG